MKYLIKKILRVLVFPILLIVFIYAICRVILGFMIRFVSLNGNEIQVKYLRKVYKYIKDI